MQGNSSCHNLFRESSCRATVRGKFGRYVISKLGDVAFGCQYYFGVFCEGCSKLSSSHDDIVVIAIGVFLFPLPWSSSNALVLHNSQSALPPLYFQTTTITTTRITKTATNERNNSGAGGRRWDLVPKSPVDSSGQGGFGTVPE